MSGFVICYGTCVNCHRQFSFNPNKVPSVRVDGVREPVCRSCMQQANARRVALDLPPHPIEPDAYEPLPEGEL
jgi:hypothetical protein